MASRRIEDCHPLLAEALRSCVEQWQRMDLDILITCTWRAQDEQARLYAQGRTTPGRIVTNARPGYSAHNYTIDGMPASLAFDIVPLSGGKPVWETKGAARELWTRAAQPAKALGLRWYGDPGSAFQEYPHFQHPLWDSVKP